MTEPAGVTTHSPLGLAPGTWTCTLHPAKTAHGAARPVRGVVHHVWPRGAGGPDVPGNRVVICANGHDAVHAVMWELANGRPAPSCARSELALARRGVAEWVAAGGVVGVGAPAAFNG